MALKDLFKIFDKKRREIRKSELDFAKKMHSEVVSISEGVEPLCDSLRATCDEMIKSYDDKQENNPNRKRTRNGLESFDLTREEIEGFILKFIDVAIPDKELNQKLKNELKDFELMETIKPNGVSGSVGPKMDNGRIVGVRKEVYIGEHLPNGKITTNLHEIQTYIHELFHAVSSKHNILQNDRGETHLQSQKHQEIGEIESLFSEQLFVHILKTQSDKFKTDEGFPFGLDDEALKKDTTILTYDSVRDFLDRSKMVSDDKHFEIGRKKIEQYRYIVGMVGSNVLMEEYLENPEKACEFLKNFLRYDYRLDKDMSVQILSGGKVENYDKGKDRLKAKFAKKIAPPPSEELDAAKKEIDGEHPQQLAFVEPSRSKSMQNNEETQENGVQIEK